MSTRATTKPKPKPASVIVKEATGKRIRQLSVAEPYTGAEDLWVEIKFDDDTNIYIELSARLRFGVNYVQSTNGNTEPIKEFPKRFLRAGN
jgi:hypothetical protein